MPAVPAVVSVSVAGAAAAAVAFAGLGFLAENPPGRALATGLGVGGAFAITLASGFLFYGSRPRPAGDVQNRWLGATVARFLGVPCLAVSIYFFLPAGGQYAVLATVGTHLACLAAETATVVRMVNQGLDRPRQ